MPPEFAGAEVFAHEDKINSDTTKSSKEILTFLISKEIRRSLG